MDTGTYNDAISITSNVGNGSVTVSMTVPGPSLAVNPQNLSFGTATTTLWFRVYNNGGGTLSWTATKNVAWAFFGQEAIRDVALPTQISGITEPYSFTDVQVTVSRIGYKPGDYNGSIAVASNGGNATVALTMSVIQIPQ